MRDLKVKILLMSMVREDNSIYSNVYDDMFGCLYKIKYDIYFLS